jgi:SAM-dependent methyltransferase
MMQYRYSDLSELPSRGRRRRMALFGRGRRCDITRDDVEPASSDLVHSRFLLMHLDDPADALRRVAAALRPGGWLVAGEPDNDVAGSVDPAHPLRNSSMPALASGSSSPRSLALPTSASGKVLRSGAPTRIRHSPSALSRSRSGVASRRGIEPLSPGFVLAPPNAQDRRERCCQTGVALVPPTAFSGR